MAVSVPQRVTGETSNGAPRLFLALAGARGVLFGAALLLAPWLYREHVAALVLLRPTKEVFLFAGFSVRAGHASLPVVFLAALPLLLGGVWVFFGLGRGYADQIEDADLPGVAGRILPAERINNLRGALDEHGMRVVFLGRLAAFPSTLMAAAAGSAGVSWKEFLVADTAGALVSLSALLAVGYALGETYDEAGPWVTVAGVVVLAGLAVLIGRTLVKGGSSGRS
jgi:membrane protein DedA with SNARE-associated domain